MIPATYPSVLNITNKNEMLVYPITIISGMERWKDYIPVKFIDQVNAEENTHNNNGYKAVKILESSTGKQAWLDYVPVYIDSAATDAWEVEANGYIPVGISGASLSLQFAGATTLDPRITFSRASTATRVNSAGLIETVSSNAPRFDHDPVTGESKGLLIEEQRTNLLTYSENFSNAVWPSSGVSVSANAETAPDGMNTADLWTNTSSLGVMSQAITKAASAVTYAGSLWVKSSVTDFTLTIDDGGTVNRGRVVFNLSNGTVGTTMNDGTFTGTSGGVAAYPNGWYRVSVVTTTNSTTVARLRAFFGTIGKTAYIWGAQLEAGSFPTSYIPTVASQVTRSADSASMTDSNFSSWYRADEGTLYAEATPSQNLSTARAIVDINNASVSNRVSLLQAATTGYGQCFVGDSGATQASLSPALSLGNSGKLTLAYKTNDFAASVNSSSVLTDTTGSVPTVTQLLLGSRSDGANNINGTIKRLAYYPKRLSNTELQGLTS